MRLDTIVGGWVVDSSSVTKVSLGFAGFRSTKKDGIGSLRGTKCELIKCEAFSAVGDNALAGILGESKCADGHLWALDHADIISYLSDNNSNLSLLVGHVL